MLYITDVNDYTVRFTSGTPPMSKDWDKNLVAHSDEIGRVWVKSIYKHENLLNSKEVEDITLVDSDGYSHTYADAESFAADFNLMMKNQELSVASEVTTTTTTAP